VIAFPLHVAADPVAYSRVHTGVHYPGDVLVGSMLGTVLAQLTSRLLDRYG
jgi:membrane-associated phospholipid phosphatase